LTNGIIAKVICYQFKEYLSEFKVIKFFIHFEGIDTGFTYVFNTKNFNLIINSFDDYPNFYDDVFFCLKEFNDPKMAIMRRIVNDIYFEYEEDYDINGFWKVLEGVSFYHNNYNLETVKEYKYFLRLVGTLKFQSEDYNFNTDLYESMKVLLKKYQIDNDVLYMKSNELDAYLLKESSEKSKRI